MKSKLWIAGWLVLAVAALGVLGSWVYRVDPYFHYHKPDLQTYFYPLDNQRSQNDGITRHFDYDALITGTSMTENFQTSEADRVFGCTSIKVPYSGGSYKEINDNLIAAFDANPNLKTVIRCLDMSSFFNRWDEMRTDLGEFPTYLYDADPFNDVQYLLNREVLFNRVYPMTQENDWPGFQPGITSFDDYSRWQSRYTFGIGAVVPNGIPNFPYEANAHLTEAEKEIIKENIERNVTSLADAHPEADFYYFYPPYSIIYWNKLVVRGVLEKQLEAERYITGLIVSHPNIHLFSFNLRTDIITNLNNYKDDTHYATWINSLMLQWMHDDTDRLTEENYQERIDRELACYSSYNYESIWDQEDYEADLYAAALLNRELTGAEPLDLLNDGRIEITYRNAEPVVQEGKTAGFDCRGTLAERSTGDLGVYLREEDYIGARFTVDLTGGHRYLSFAGQKLADHGGVTVFVYDDAGAVVGKSEVRYHNLDDQPHRYVIDLSGAEGVVTVVMHGGYIDSTGSPESLFRYSDVVLY